MIEITGGTFVGYNPAASASENPVMNFVKYGYMAKETSVAGTYEVVENPLEKASINGGEFQLKANETLTRALTVTKDMILDLNGKKLENTTVIGDDCIALEVTNGATLTIKGEGQIHATGEAGYAMAVWANGGVVNIENGDFYNTGKADEGADLIYASNGGKVYIAGGTFKSEYVAKHLGKDDYGYQYALLNCKGQTDFDNVIEVTGGTFHKFNPANNVAENPKVNFVAEGYESIQNGDDFVVTVKKAAAGETVTLSTDGIITNSIAVPGGTLDGNGYTLYQSVGVKPTTNHLVHGTGAATIKNLNIVGANTAWDDNGTARSPRALYFTDLNGDITIENVETSGVCYALNVNASSATKESNLIVKNSILRGWTSFSKVTFAAGNYFKAEADQQSNKYCRPYVDTRFDGCAFEKGFKIDAYHQTTNSAGTVTATYNPVIEIKNCTLDGVAITETNWKDLFEFEDETTELTKIKFIK